MDHRHEWVAIFVVPMTEEPVANGEVIHVLDREAMEMASLSPTVGCKHCHTPLASSANSVCPGAA